MNSLNLTKKVGVTLLAGVMLMSATSCSLFEKPKVLEAADSFGDAFLSNKAKNIIELSTEDSDGDLAQALDYFYDDANYSDNQSSFFDAIRGAMTYEVDKGSVEISGDEASCDIVFSLPDYESVADDEFADIDEFLDAVSEADLTEITFTAEFEKEDGEWLVSNLEDDDFGELYDYIGFEIPVGGDVVGEYSAEYDMTDIITNAMGEIDVDDVLYAVLNLSLNEDGSFVLAFDSETTSANFTTYFENNIDEIMMTMLQVDSMDRLEEMATNAGYSSYAEFRDAIINEMVGICSTENMPSEYTASGTYTVDGNNITLTPDSETGSNDVVGTIENGIITLTIEETHTVVFTPQQ